MNTQTWMIKKFGLLFASLILLSCTGCMTVPGGPHPFATMFRDYPVEPLQKSAFHSRLQGGDVRVEAVSLR